ncbi:Cyclic di-GMP phosphodiesterase [bioreactor metagenome]|uniref:Cyclic di-GMP phosphodiesterase n=1 Tax=bioreactor metagenome TaxID=1076179 RepID=A0A645I4S0_9ZZZZ
MGQSHITDLRLFAKFHDIGKAVIPEEIIFKPSQLSPAEWTEIRRHPEIGYRICKSLPDLVPFPDWILKHHEWWNGKGYPLGLKGEAIPFEARILSIVDAYDAMTSERPYRPALSNAESIAELRRGAGSQFDPSLVEKFIDLIEKDQ